MFFDNLIYNASSDAILSLNNLCIDLEQEHCINVTRQSLHERYNQKSAFFLKEILNQLPFSGNLPIADGWLEKFNAVRIKDSTRFVLPEEYANQMRGFGGVSSKSGACIQYEYDLKTGTIIDLNITPSNRPDSKDAYDTKDNVNPKELIIRDLGYYSTEVLKGFIEKEAYIISKLNAKTLVYEQHTKDKYELLDFRKLYRRMNKNNLKQIEKQVYVGSKEKLPVRLIIETVPEEVFNARMRKANKYNKQRGYTTTDEHIIRSKFNLIITNILIESMPKEVVVGFYHLRWQIELVFKIWKSTFGIHKIGKMKYYRWLSILYVKLILIAIYWQTIMAQRSYMYQDKGKLLSIDKSFKTLRNKTYKLRKAIKKGGEAFIHLNTWICAVYQKDTGLKKRKIN